MYNPMTLIDFYKADHRRQYPAGTSRVYSNMTPRSSRVEGQDRVVFFGLQAAIQRHLIDDMRAFFAAPVDDVCERYAARINGALGPNSIGTDHIRALHALGYLPLEFRALPEGTAVPLRVPMFTVENTHDDFAWLVNYYETILSASVWGPCTSATYALRLKRLLLQYANDTGASTEFTNWQGHDFSMRGMMGVDAAAMSGAGHLLYFTGTDTVPALDWVETYYPTSGFIGGSVAATEHSVMCAGGAENETETFERLLALYPAGIVSVVSDTWDLWHVLQTILPSLRTRIMAREGKMVIRPDSGDPVKIICGDPDAPADSPARKGVVQLLWEVFGGTVNTAGFRELDSHIGVIYGDSINYERAVAILEGLKAIGFTSSNIVLGVGSFSYQYVTRDTYGFAMKATHVVVDGVGHSIFKKPATDDGQKNSATGYLSVFDGFGGLTLAQDVSRAEMERESLLQPVWRDGVFLQRYSFDEVRAVATVALNQTRLERMAA